MTEKLLPCPLCNSTEIIHFERQEGLFVVSCENDDCHFVVETMGASLAEAISRWNTRCSQGGNAEPAAWRWKAKDSKHWVYDPSDAWREDNKDDPAIEFQPLYTHSPPANNDWRPIETAPKDGTHILAYRVPIGIRFTTNTNPPTVVHWFNDPDEPGFYTSVNEMAPEHPFNPTHWKPLDAPPTLSREESHG